MAAAGLADAGPDVVALAAEVQGRGQADAGAGAGDQGDGHDASSGTEGDYYERGDTIYRMSDEAKPSNFIRDIILEHNRTGRFGGKVVTRFPPEPNGYLHIGHAKAISIDFGMAREFGGRCNLRFDDTNPTKESQEYVDAIMRDIRWLGFDWGGHLYHASDYFEQLYQWAEQLIQAGKAYVDDLTRRADPRVPRHPDRAGPAVAVPRSLGRGEPGPVPADAGGRVRRRRPRRCARRSTWRRRTSTCATR